MLYAPSKAPCSISTILFLLTSRVAKFGSLIIGIISKMGLIYDHHLLKRPRALILVIWLSARIRWVVVVGIPDGIS